jgi:dephospho-CoA kinase
MVRMRIAVTGGIASGKSTILQMLRKRGIFTLSADALAKDVLWDESVQDRLMSRFESEEPVSGVVLKSLLMQGNENRRAINRIMHPAIVSQIEASSATFIEVPLLFETCLQTSFDAIWVASCAKEVQISRLRARYGEKANFDQISWQLDSKVARAFADAVIDTSVSQAETLGSLLQEGKSWGIELVVS